MAGPPKEEQLVIGHCTLQATRYTLHATSCTLHTTIYTLHTARCTLPLHAAAARCTLHAARCTAGSWNDECEKETPAAPEKRDPMVLDMSLPPPGSRLQTHYRHSLHSLLTPGHDPRAGEWGGNFQAGRRGSGRPWQTDPAPEESNRWGGGREPAKAERGRGGFEPRGRGRGGRGGRGGYMENREQRPNVDIVQVRRILFQSMFLDVISILHGRRVAG